MAEKSTQTVASSDVPESRQTDTTQSSMIRLNAYTRLIALQTVCISCIGMRGPNTISVIQPTMMMI